MKYVFFLLLLLFSYNGFSQCTGLEPPYSLGPDVTICSGTVLTLTGPAGYSNYSWSNGSQAPSISLLNPGTYTVSSTIASLVGTNLVLNGDFENGTTAAANNFTTAYVPGTGGTWGLLSNPGQYAISTSPNLVHNNFYVCSDHTTGAGNMLIANGASTANTTVWSQTVPVTPGQGYLFSYWVASVENSSTAALAQLQLFINNTPISVVAVPSTQACVWTQFSGTWVAGNATTNAILKIVNQSTAAAGNDFSIDDIIFRQVCTKKDTIVVAVNNVQVNGGPDLSFCEGDTDTLVATTNNVNNVLTWTPGGTPGSNTFVPTASGVYTVTATSPFNCIKTDNVTVTVRGMNWAIDSLGSIPSDCGDSTGQASALVLPISATLPPPLPFSYAWSGPGAGNPILTNGPLISNLSAGMYFLTVTSDGCSRDTFIQVGVNSAPIASFTAAPTSGTAPLDVLFQNTSQLATGYYWNFSNGDSLITLNLDDQNQTYVDTGVYIVYLVAYSGACSDTMFDTIYVYPPYVPVPLPEFFPVVFETSNVFTPNGDASNNFFTFKMENIVSLEVTIFNRWGDLMYQCNNPATFFWDGKTPEGMEANDGVYFYVYKATGAQKENFEGNGFLHLFR